MKADDAIPRSFSISLKLLSELADIARNLEAKNKILFHQYSLLLFAFLSLFASAHLVLSSFFWCVEFVCVINGLGIGSYRRTVLCPGSDALKR